MWRRALAIAVAGALLFEARARADAAQIAAGSVVAFVLPALCAYVATGVTEEEEQRKAAGKEGGGKPGKEAAKEAAEKAGEEAAAAGFDRPGWQLGAAYGMQFEDFDNLGNRSADNSFGMKLGLGYRCSPHFGWEFDYEWADSFDLSPGSDVDLWTLTSDARWYLLTGPVQPFLVTGVGILTGTARSTSETDLTFRFGGGLDYYLAASIALSFDLSYVIPTNKVKDLNYVSASWGFLYRF